MKKSFVSLFVCICLIAGVVDASAIYDYQINAEDAIFSVSLTALQGAHFKVYQAGKADHYTMQAGIVSGIEQVALNSSDEQVYRLGDVSQATNQLPYQRFSVPYNDDLL